MANLDPQTAPTGPLPRRSPRGEVLVGYKRDHYVQRLLDNERVAFKEQFNAFDQQFHTAKWTVVLPTHSHLFTVVLLHPRNDFPQRLAHRIFDSEYGKGLLRRHCGVKWVFPKAPPSLMRFGRPPMWFGDYESPGHDTELEDNARYVRQVVEEEAKLLIGDKRKVILGGVEQGAAMALYALLMECIPSAVFLGMGGWLHTKAIIEEKEELRRRVQRREMNSVMFLLPYPHDEVVTASDSQDLQTVLLELGLNVCVTKMQPGSSNATMEARFVEFVMIAMQLHVAEDFDEKASFTQLRDWTKRLTQGSGVAHVQHAFHDPAQHAQSSHKSTKAEQNDNHLSQQETPSPTIRSNQSTNTAASIAAPGTSAVSGVIDYSLGNSPQRLAGPSSRYCSASTPHRDGSNMLRRSQRLNRGSSSQRARGSRGII